MNSTTLPAETQAASPSRLAALVEQYDAHRLRNRTTARLIRDHAWAIDALARGLREALSARGDSRRDVSRATLRIIGAACDLKNVAARLEGNQG